jgi:hypothetical protein
MMTPMTTCSNKMGHHPIITLQFGITWMNICLTAGLAVLLPMTWHFVVGHPGHLALPPVIFSVGICEGRCICATPATRSARVTTVYCYCHWNHRHGHAVPCMARTRLLPGHNAAWHAVPTLNLCDVSKTESFPVRWCLTRFSIINSYFILNT